MRFYKNNTRLFVAMLSTICVVFPLQLILTPLSYAGQAGFEAKDYSENYIPDKAFPLGQRSGASYIVNLTENEILTDVVFNTIINKSIRDNRRVVNRVKEALLVPLVIIGIIYLTIYYNIKQSRKKSVLAFSMGGHAPPAIGCKV